MLDANPRLVQQINFTGNIEQFGDTKMILNLGFFKRNRESIVNTFHELYLIFYFSINIKSVNTQCKS